MHAKCAPYSFRMLLPSASQQVGKYCCYFRLGYRMANHLIVVHMPVGPRDFYFLLNVHTGSVAHIAFLFGRYQG